MTETEDYQSDGPESEFNPESIEKLTRSDLLKVTSHAIKHLQPKATGGRFRDQDLERLRDSKMRLLLDASKVHASILKDEVLESIEKRLAALEAKA